MLQYHLFEGEMGVLKNHIPIVTFLRPGFVEIIGSQKKRKVFFRRGDCRSFQMIPC